MKEEKLKDLPQDISQLKKLPPRNDSNCFGCSPGNDRGLKMTFYTDETAVYSKLNVPSHLCGWDTLIHGGVITTILDEITSWASIYLLQKIILTKSITVHFLRPLYIEQEVTAAGYVIEQTSEREAKTRGILYNAAGELCARAKGTIALFTPEAARRLGVMSENDLNDMARFGRPLS